TLRRRSARCEQACPACPPLIVVSKPLIDAVKWQRADREGCSPSIHRQFPKGRHSEEKAQWQSKLPPAPLEWVKSCNRGTSSLLLTVDSRLHCQCPHPPESPGRIEPAQRVRSRNDPAWPTRNRYA